MLNLVALVITLAGTHGMDPPTGISSNSANLEDTMPGMDLPARISSHMVSLGDAILLTCALDTDLGDSCQWETPGGEIILVNEEEKVLGNHGKGGAIQMFNSPSTIKVVFSDASTDLYKLSDGELNSFPVYKNKEDSYLFVNCDAQWSLGGVFKPNYTNSQTNPTPLSPPETGWLSNKRIQNEGKILEKIVATEKKTCGVKIKEENISQYKGDWICRFFFDEIDGEKEGSFLGAVVNTEEKVTTNLRLAKHLKPIHYDLSIIADIFSNDPKIDSYFGGKAVMKLEAQETADYVMFHAEGLNIKHIEISCLHGIGKELLDIKGILFDYKKTIVNIYLKNSLFEASKTYEVTIIYDTTPALGMTVWEVDRQVGFYRENCGDFLCWFTQFEPTYARRAFPCLDEPALKATFGVRIARTEELTALANMPLLQTIPMDRNESWAWEILHKAPSFLENTNLVWDVFEPSVQMSTYLVAFSISDYAAAEEGHNHVKVWGPKTDIKQGKGNFSCKIGSELIDFYEDFFQVKYSVPKTDMIAAGNRGGAMENWGLITYGSWYLLSAPKEDRKDYRWTVSIVSHELAHEWLGNLVTCQWWDFIWLNEGLTHYLSQYGTDHVLPEAKIWDKFMISWNYMVPVGKDINDDKSKAKALNKHVVTREEIKDKFDKITYNKGGIIAGMMDHILTTPVFLKGLHSYLSSKAYETAVDTDLFNYLEAAGIEEGTWNNEGNHSFATSMMTWTDQEGIPLVTVNRSWSGSNDSFSLKQSQFLFPKEGNLTAKLNHYQTEVAKGNGLLWDIPITMSTVGGPNDDWNTTTPSLWLTTHQPELRDRTLPGLTSQIPIVLNVQRMGYFLVNYDEENWKLIGDALAKNKDDIHPYNRAQIVFDIKLLAQMGLVRRETETHVLSYFQEEDNEMIQEMDGRFQRLEYYYK